jgi:SH3-like domain-containing protein
MLHEGKLYVQENRQLEKIQLTDGTEGWIESAIRK